MKRARWVQGVIAGIGVLAACGGDEVPLYDPSTFAGMNVDKLQYACKQTVDCRNQMGLALPEDPYTVCMDDTADLLSKDSARQQRFLTNYSRCSAFVVCEFYNCANANTVAYGESQRAKVTYDCQQAIACNTAFGMAPPNVGLALDSCVSQNIGLLDSYAAEKRASFENAYAMCSTLSGCDFRNCFVY